jgi:hypothetical protein
MERKPETANKTTSVRVPLPAARATAYLSC